MKAVYAPVWNEPYKDLFHRFLELWFHCPVGHGHKIARFGRPQIRLMDAWWIPPTLYAVCAVPMAALFRPAAPFHTAESIGRSQSPRYRCMSAKARASA